MQGRVAAAGWTRRPRLRRPAQIAPEVETRGNRREKVVEPGYLGLGHRLLLGVSNGSSRGDDSRTFHASLRWEIETNGELNPIGSPDLAADDLTPAVEILDAGPGALWQKPVEEIDRPVVEARVEIGRVVTLRGRRRQAVDAVRGENGGPEVLVTSHVGGEPDRLQLAVRIGHGGQGRTVAADAVTEGDLPVGVVAPNRLHPPRHQHAPEIDGVRLALRWTEARPAEKARDIDVPARALVTDTCGQVGHRSLGLAGYSRRCRDRRFVVLERSGPRHIRIQLLRPTHLRLPDRREGHR